MKFHETEFAKQLFAVVVGVTFLVANVAFFSIPTSLGCSNVGSDQCRLPAITWHLT
jgi:hypothetical protein